MLNHEARGATAPTTQPTGTQIPALKEQVAAAQRRYFSGTGPISDYREALVRLRRAESLAEFYREYPEEIDR